MPYPVTIGKRKRMSFSKIKEIADLVSNYAGIKKINKVVSIKLVKGLAPFFELYYRIRKKTPLFTKYSLYTLKANANFMSLQEELSNTESKIAYSRESYNNVTTAYNTKLEIFPNNIIAGMFNFKSEELFKVDNEEAKQNVKVSF